MNNMENKQTAVEWLINEHFGGIENCTPDFRNKIKRAKEIEKEQIMDSYIMGSYDFEDKIFRPTDYYKETFKFE